MKRPSTVMLLFAVAFAVFLIVPPLVSKFEFPPYPLMKVADAFDILTPLVLLPLYWLLLRLGQPSNLRPSEMTLFFVFAALWAMGQGMHLSANSIGHLLTGMESTDIYKLTSFYDEVLSHYLWHIGIVGLSAFLIWQSWKAPWADNAPAWSLLISGIIHGFTFFLIVIEAGTAPLGVSYAVLAVIFGVIWGRRDMGRRPVATFFLISCLVAILFIIGWGVYWRGLPQFSEVGII